LRFPLWVRNRRTSYDLALFVANWPKVRAPAWNILLKARAIENQCYVAGVNRIGTDGNGLVFGGDSAVIDPWGEPVRVCGDREDVAVVTLQRQILEECRRRFPAWMDADPDVP
jgi:predicted amidohydrolase